MSWHCCIGRVMGGPGYCHCNGRGTTALEDLERRVERLEKSAGLPPLPAAPDTTGEG